MGKKKCNDTALVACANCNKFDHNESNCAEKPNCVNCGGAGHSSKERRKCATFIKWEERSLKDEFDKLLRNSNMNTYGTYEGYKNGRLLTNQTKQNWSNDNHNSNFDSSYANRRHTQNSNQNQSQINSQLNANSYSSRTTSYMDDMNERLRNLEKNCSTIRAPNNSILNWSKEEFLSNISNNFKEKLNDELITYREFQCTELEHMFETREYDLTKKILDKVKNSDYEPLPPPQSRYDKSKYDDYFLNRVLNVERCIASKNTKANANNNLF